MPCVTLAPPLVLPRDARCGASVLPLPRRDAPLAKPTTLEPTLEPTAEPSTSFYARLWRFLRHWNEHEPTRAALEPTRRHRRLSACSEMRRRVGMLQELESHEAPRGPRAMQATCANCRQRFFRDLAAASTEATDYCSLDCRSSAQYRATVQESIDALDALDASRL